MFNNSHCSSVVYCALTRPVDRLDAMVGQVRLFDGTLARAAGGDEGGVRIVLFTLIRIPDFIVRGVFYRS